MASSDNPRDTIADLAKKIRLNASEYKDWLTRELPSVPQPASEHEAVRCKSFRVPNTILAYWAGELAGVGQWKVDWSGFKQAFEQKGLKVIEREGLNAKQFGRIITTETYVKTLYGVYIWGHGSPGSITVSSGSTYSYEQWAKDDAYSLGLGLLFACHSDTGKDAFSDNALFWGSCGILSPLSAPTHVGITLATIAFPLLGAVIPDTVKEVRTYFGSDFPGIDTFLEPLDKDE